jgi:thioredoxin reductase (NADPH)
VTLLYDVIIIGGGPAGLTAGMYTSRARLNTLIIAGHEPGGQITLTYQVDNYLGFHNTITGPELIERFLKHATKFGAKILKKEATAVDFSKEPYKVFIGEEFYEAKSIVIATGSRARKLGLESEERLFGKGVFACATCDAVLYQDLKVVVVGGGDSAVQEALDMARFASEVYLIHRRDALTACLCLRNRAMDEDKIKFLYDTEVIDILGENVVEAIKTRNLETGKEETLKTDGVLVAIGWLPNSSIFKDQLEIDMEGYIVADGVKTSKNGVFIAGDIIDKEYRQVITACGSGCQASLEVERYLFRSDRT